jgi:CubicO group peptidase (beta-lactamase class C family)
VLPHGPTGIHAGAFSAIGAHGQYIYVNPAERLVVALQSAWRQNSDPGADLETFALIGATVRALRPDPTP